VPLAGGIPDSYVSVGTDLLKGSSLLGFFPLPPPEVPQMICMVSIIPHDPTNPWILLTSSDIDSYGEHIPLSLADLAYQVIDSTSDSSASLVTTNDTASSPIMDPSNDLLDEFLPLGEAIQDIMSLEE